MEELIDTLVEQYVGFDHPVLFTKENAVIKLQNEW